LRLESRQKGDRYSNYRRCGLTNGLTMNVLQSCYVLVLDQQSEDTEYLTLLLQHLRCACVVVASTDQFIDIAIQSTPYLVLVGGDPQTWSSELVEKLRQLQGSYHSTILALSDRHAPSWLLQEENPGFDGFLVKPISGDVLTSVVESARMRHRYCVMAESA
jgi:DNA-binding NarL/FixJ family response regulator